MAYLPHLRVLLLPSRTGEKKGRTKLKGIRNLHWVLKFYKSSAATSGPHLRVLLPSRTGEKEGKNPQPPLSSDSVNQATALDAHIAKNCNRNDFKSLEKKPETLPGGYLFRLQDVEKGEKKTKAKKGRKKKEEKTWKHDKTPTNLWFFWPFLL